MKKLWKWGSLLLVLVLSLFIFSDSMKAQTHEDDHVLIQMHLEQDADNAKGIIVRLAVTNIGMDAIENVEIESILPNGINLVNDEVAEATIASIAPGMTEELAFHTTIGSAFGIGTILMIIIGVLLVALIILLVILIRRYIKSAKAVTTLVLCFILAATPILEPITVFAAEGETIEVEFEESIEINNKTYTFETRVSYTTLPVIEAEGVELTRGEWMAELLEHLGYADDFDTDLVLMSYAYSLFPGDEASDPRLDEIATREFAAVTAVKALGFLPYRDLVCEDAADITYLQDVETAVSIDLFRLDDNHFYPNRELTRSEADHALSVVIDIVSSVEDSDDDEEATGEIVYNEDVLQVDEDIEYELSGNTLTLEDDSSLEGLQEGDIILLPDQTPYKITEISSDGDEYVIETEVPQIQEVIDDIDIQGTGTVDLDEFIPDENVTSFGTSRILNDIDVKGSLSGPGKVSFEADKDLGDNVSLYGELGIDLPKVKYKADVDIGWFSVDVNDAYIKLPANLEFEGGVKMATDDNDNTIGTPYRPSFDLGNLKADDGLITLGKVPVVGIPGIAAYVEVALKYSIEGQVGFVYTIDGTVGVQIKNNRPRMINTLEGNLDVKALEASVKIGPQLSALLEVCSTWPLIDFNVSVGAAGEGSLIIRDPNNCCIDGAFYMYGELTALERSILNDWIDISYENEFWDSDSSPLSFGIHFENLQRVPECTFGERTHGTITGLVADATDRTQAIPNASIKVTKQGETSVIESATSDSSGNYNISLEDGDYTIMVSAPGYISFVSDITVTAGEEQYIETLLLIDNEYKDTTANASGTIINAVTGAAIDNAKITVRKGWNKTSGSSIETLYTDSNGSFDIEAESGNYTLYIEKEGFISNFINITLVSGQSESLNGTLVPEGSSLPEGDLRVVLTWGSTPSDLDSHMVGPTADGGSYFHIYYGAKNYYYDGTTYADLDLDDTTSYGPETTTIYQMNESGTYSFYVHDYSNSGYNSSTEMSYSGAKVLVYVGEQLYMTYNIPAGREGTLWHVFNYDAATHSITTVNQYVSDYDYSYWY